MNKKLKMYRDTSVVSYLLQEDVPEKMEITNRLWELFKQGQFELFKHIVNIRTIRGVRAITNLKGYKPIEILNPSVLLESEE